MPLASPTLGRHKLQRSFVGGIQFAIEICQGCGSVAFLQRGYMSESKPKKKWQPKDRDWRSNASAASDGGKDARMAEVSDLTTQVKAKERAAGFTESEHEDAQSLERMKAKNREDAEAAAKMRVEEGAAAEKKKAEEEAAAAAKKAEEEAAAKKKAEEEAAAAAAQRKAEGEAAAAAKKAEEEAAAKRKAEEEAAAAAKKAEEEAAAKKKAEEEAAAAAAQRKAEEEASAKRKAEEEAAAERARAKALEESLAEAKRKHEEQKREIARLARSVRPPPPPPPLLSSVAVVSARSFSLTRTPPSIHTLSLPSCQRGSGRGAGQAGGGAGVEAARGRGGGAGQGGGDRTDAAAGAGAAPPPLPSLPSRTNWTRLVPSPVLNGHVSSPPVQAREEAARQEGAAMQARAREAEEKLVAAQHRTETVRSAWRGVGMRIEERYPYAILQVQKTVCEDGSEDAAGIKARLPSPPPLRSRDPER